MINVENVQQPTTYENGGVEVVNFPEFPYFDMGQYDLYSEKDYKRFIDDTERMVRTQSYEYRKLIEYLRNTEGMNKCTFLENVTNIDSTKVRIEIHHSALTLYDLCSAVICKRLHKKESMEIYDVAEEILWLHYAGWVGLIPVCKTVHELIHNQFIFVPTHVIRGNYRLFIDTYHDWIDPTVLEAVEDAERVTGEYLNNPNDVSNIVNVQKAIFNQFATYISQGDINAIPGQALERLGQANQMLKQRISDIKNKKKTLFHVIKPVSKK